MYSSPKSLVFLVVISLGILSFVSAKTTVASSSKSSESIKNAASGTSPVTSENIFLRLARSLAVEALSEFKESARRNPKFGFNMTFPIMLPGVNGTTVGALPGFFNRTDSLPGLAGLPVTIGVSALTLKSAIIAAIAGFKAAIINIVVTIFLLLFLISGTAFFVCNLGFVNCSTALGGLGGGNLGGLTSGVGGGVSSFLSSRAGLADQYDRQTRPVYKALDEGYKKYR